ncbi:hypothetical protein ABPG75_005510 [Micractinium tetrahymenae]
MVRVVSWQAGPPQCGPLPGPRSAAAFWHEATAAERGGITLPAFSLRSSRPQSAPEAPGATFTAATAACGGTVAAPAEGFLSLRNLQGPSDAPPFQPVALPLDSKADRQPAIPPFLLLRRRTPHTDAWLSTTAATLDVPWLPGLGDAQPPQQGGLLHAIVHECELGAVALPQELPLDKEKYACRPQPLELPASPGHGWQPFDLLDCLLEKDSPPGQAAGLLQLDVPLLPGGLQQGGADAAGSSLRAELQELAAPWGFDKPAAEGQAAEQPEGAAPTGFISLRELPALCCQAADGTGAPGLQEAAPHLAGPPIIRLPEPPPRQALPSFLLRSALVLPPLSPKAAAAVTATAEGPAAAGGQAVEVCALFTLDAPVLPFLASSGFTAGPAAGAPACAFLHLFQPVAVPEVSLRPTFVPAGCQPVSLAALMAQDLVLEDDCLMLPPVVLEARAGEAEAQAASVSGLIWSGCGCKQASTAHLALYLDWSLSTPQAASRPPELTAAATAMEQQLLPRELQPAAAATGAAARRQGCLQSALVQELMAPFRQRELQVASGRGQSAAAEAAGRLPVAGIAPGGRQPQKALPLPQQPAPVQPAAEPAGQAAGAPRPAKRAKRAAGAGDGMQFFLQLQRGKPGGAGGEAEPAGAASSSSSGGDTAEALEAAQRQGSITVHAVELPAGHAQLLGLLREDEARVVRGAPAPGVAAEAARSDFLSTAAVERGLQRAAGSHGQRELVKAYATMAVIRQTAACLVHHGIRCAHLYLEQSQADLPGLLSAVTAARELRAANQQVQAGQLEDSPKQAALQRILGGVAACAPGGKCCVVGHPKSFFTVYRPALDSGQPGGRICQLDRDGQLQANGAAGEPLAAAVEAAAAGAGCLLVPAELAVRDGFPCSAFQAVVVYASEPEAASVLRQQLVGVERPLHFLEVSLPTEQPLTAAAGAKPAAAAAGLVAADGAAKVRHAARTAAAGVPGRALAAQPGLAATAPHGLDWPVVISSDPNRPIRARRQLYEAVLAVEREGGTVVERRLGLVDAVLSPSAALVVCDNSAAKLEFAAFLEALSPLLGRLSYAFSRLVLVCEGTPGFQAQVLCGTERLLALGRRCGLRLQCHATTSTEATAAVVGSVARAWLAQWRSSDPGLQYAVAEEPPEEEAFLTRFYSVNPHTAAALLSTGLPLRQLLALDALDPGQASWLLLAVLFERQSFTMPAAWQQQQEQRQQLLMQQARAQQALAQPGLQLMQGRLQGPPGGVAPAAAGRWGLGEQERLAAQAAQQQQQQILLQQQEYERQQHQERLFQQQQYEQELRQQQQQQQLLAQQQYDQQRQQQLLVQQQYEQQRQQQQYEHQQLQEQRYQELLLQQREQQLLLARQQQQAEADAFPEMNAVLPGWQLAAAGPRLVGQSLQLQEQWQGQVPALPPLPHAAGTVASGVIGSGGSGGGAWAQQQQQLMPHQGGQLVDEFGVPMEPSMSDDESEANAACGQASVAMPGAHQQPPQQQMLHRRLMLPGPGRAGGAALALGQPAVLAAPAQADGGGSGGGQMAPFLSSRSRDFAVPRMGKPLASRQLTPQREASGAPGLAAPSFDADEGHAAPGPKRQRGAGATSSDEGGTNNLLRPTGGRGGGGGGSRRANGWGGRRGGGRWGGGGGRWGGGGYKSNKPSRAW